MNGAASFWRDRGLRAAAALVLVVLSGFVSLWLGWRGVAAQLYVDLQLPFLVSGIFGGLALIGTGGAILLVHLGRRAAAVEREALDELIHDAAALESGSLPRS